MHPHGEFRQLVTRRHFLGRTATGLGVAALASLLRSERSAAESAYPAISGLPHFVPRAKRVIYLFQSGAPSQLETWDYKPKLAELHKTELPDSVRMGQRLTGMTANQKSFPVVASKFPFSQHGQAGTWVSDLLPYTAKVVDRMCIVRSLFTEAINHDPAITLMQTGSQQPGRPSVGAWATYGLGSASDDLPAFVVLISQGTGKQDCQGLLARLWGSGFLPSRLQGVKFRSTGDPVVYLNNPPGIDAATRRRMLDGVAELNQIQLQEIGAPEIAARIEQYELAFRMQTSVPELTDMSDEPEHVFQLYGDEARRPGTFAANCLLARRMVERGVRFIQLYHRGWDHHGGLPDYMVKQCHDIDQPSYALIEDLAQRGLLDDTLIVWAGEFGRTVYCQGEITPESYGRDHHPRCFTVWLAGGGARGGTVYGETDDFSYNVVRDGVHVHDLNATILHLLGIDHERLTYRYQGRDYRLTDVAGQVVSGILA